MFFNLIKFYSIYLLNLFFYIFKFMYFLKRVIINFYFFIYNFCSFLYYIVFWFDVYFMCVILSFRDYNNVVI